MLIYVKGLSTVPDVMRDCSVTSLRCVACNIKLTKKLRDSKITAVLKVITPGN